MEDTKPKTFVFVLMPFSGEFADIYEVGIKQACKDAGAYCERVDEQFFDESILERVYNQISRADVIVAEMTGGNLNVLYEVGYAHALNKRVILLIKNAAEIPFDLKHFPHIIYENISALKAQLETRIRWCIENPKESIAKADINLEFYADGQLLERNSSVRLKKKLLSDNLLIGSVRLDVHNNGAQVIDCKNIRVYLVMVREVARTYFSEDYINDKLHVLPDGRHMLPVELTDDYILPDGWAQIEFSVIAHRDGLEQMPASITLRLYSHFGKQDYHLVVYPPSDKKD